MEDVRFKRKRDADEPCLGLVEDSRLAETVAMVTKMVEDDNRIDGLGGEKELVLYWTKNEVDTGRFDEKLDITV